MTPYFITYAILVAALAGGLFLGQVRLAAIAAFLPMLVLIVGRGWVGTDSAIYVQQFDVTRYQGFLAGGFEPGFSILVYLLTYVFADSSDILILLGSVTAITMFVAGMMLERSPILFLTVVLPFFMLDMSMNGLRYGLAFAIVSLGAAALARDRQKIFIACCILAASIQVSSVLLAVGLWILTEIRLKTFAGVAAGLTAAMVFFGERVEDKFSQNTDLAGLGGASGLVPLIATFAIASAVGYNNRKLVGNQLPLLAIIGMQLIAFAFARFYYAGLRVQSLILFLLYLFTAVMARKAAFEVVKNRIFTWALTFTLAISTASRLKNFSDDMSGLSPFNPYYFEEDINS